MWKTLFGRRLYTSPSQIKVEQNRWYRWITFNQNDIQTLLNRRHPSRPGLHYLQPMIQIIRSMPGDTCVLGLGGGGILHAVNHVLPGWALTAVEINPEIIDLAFRFFMLDKIQSLVVVHQNAKQFMLQTTQTFQHLIIDLHDGSNYPAECNSLLFFESCKRALKPGGMVCLNLLHVSRQPTLFQHLKVLFPSSTLVIPIPNTANTLIFGFNLTQDTQFQSYLPKLPVKNVHWDPTWGWMATQNI